MFCKFLACFVASVGAVSVACHEANVVDDELCEELLQSSVLVSHSFVEVIVVEARCVERVGDSMSQHCFSADVDCCVVHSVKEFVSCVKDYSFYTARKVPLNRL